MSFGEEFFECFDLLQGLRLVIQNLAFGHEELGFLEIVLIELYFSESIVIDGVEQIELGNNG